MSLLRNRTFGRALALTCLFLNLGALYFWGVRPWLRTWGASADEIRATLPGDELVPKARASDQSTHAITIEVPPKAVWPWLAQLGQDRAGFYSFALLEDLVGCDMPNADRIHPEFQHWKLGDKLWMYPPERIDGMGHALLAHYEPGVAMGFRTRQLGTAPDAPYDGSWSFILKAQEAGSTRLLARGRAAGERSFWAAAFDHFVFEPVHYIMERRMFENIKARAEGRHLSPYRDLAQLSAWALSLALMLGMAVLVFRCERWIEALAGLTAAAGLFQVLTFLQPGPLATAVGLITLCAAAWLLAFPRGTTASENAAGSQRGSRHAA